MDVSSRLKRLRRELSVADEQLLHIDGESDDARLRALVAETPLADANAREASRHAEAQRRHRDDLTVRIVELEREQDALLDRMASGIDGG